MCRMKVGESALKDRLSPQEPRPGVHLGKTGAPRRNSAENGLKTSETWPAAVTLCKISPGCHGEISVEPLRRGREG